MKKLLFIMIMSLVVATGFAQDTYYWVGGTAEGNIGSAGNWNTSQNGSGSSRTANAADILIVDGTNIGGSSPAQGTVTININTATTAQVKIINGASVVLVRNSGTASNGTLTIANNTVGEAGLIIDATSSLQLNNTSQNGNVYLDFPTATANIAGTVKMVESPFVNSPRITSRTAGAIVFTSGASLEYDNNDASGYPFGTVGSGSSNSVNGAIVFQSGAGLINNSIYSPFGSSAASSIVDFKSGSNYYVRKTMTTGSITNAKTFANVFIQNGAVLTTDAAALNKIENLTIDANSRLNVGTSSSTPLPVTGNLTVDGAIDGEAGPGNFIMVMGGNSPQTISGSGSIKVTNFIIADNADVILNNDVTVLGASNIYGRLNFGTKQIKGAGQFTSRVSFVPTTGETQTGASTTNGSYQVTVATGLNLSALQGLSVSGPGIPANTNIVSYSSSNGQINLSKPATATATGVTLTFGSNAATLVTGNANGFDASGSVAATGAQVYQSGTNYVFNAATITPFAASSNNDLGDVTFNANAGTNKSVTMNGKLTLNNARLTISEGNSVTMAATGSFDGSFGSLAYVVTAANTGDGAVGVLKLTALSASTLIPVGSATHYLPVTLAPTETSDFDINVFEGATADATPNGPALSADQKKRVVDAVWNINRTLGSGNVGVTLGWSDALEGTDFAGYADAQIGVAAYNGTAWTTFTGSGNAANNTATLSTGTLLPFTAGENSTQLPVTFGSVEAFIKDGLLTVNWTSLAESNNRHYEIEASSDGVHFQKIGDDVLSKAKDGNSDMSLSYSFSYHTGGGLLAISLAGFIAMVWWGKRRRWVLYVVVFSALSLSYISCSKSVSDVIDISNKKLFIRIAQVDKDGTKTYSKTVQVAVDGR